MSQRPDENGDDIQRATRKVTLATATREGHFSSPEDETRLERNDGLDNRQYKYNYIGNTISLLSILNGFHK